MNLNLKQIVESSPCGDTEEFFKGVVSTWGFLMKHNERVSCSELADRIKAFYDIGNPRTYVDYEFLKTADRILYRRY